MNSSYKKWKQLFIFCIGLAVGTAFCMKWLESDFWVKGEKFTMLGLELFYPSEKVMTILSNLDDHVSTVLSYHLHFDFVFMAGIFPGISALCMIAREKIYSPRLKKFLFVLAAIQLLAWAGDITENIYLINWLEHPVIGNDFGIYHTIVFGKWIIALSGFLFSAFLFLSHFKTKNK